MNSICLYTIINPKTWIKDYTCNPDYAEYKSKQGYIVNADIIKRQPQIFYYKKG